MLAAYITLTMDALRLHKHERGKGIHYRAIGALKLAQLGVDQRFRGRGFGKFLVGYTIETARAFGQNVGCRYVTLDAQPDLVAWYERQGFVRNKLMQDERQDEAKRHGRPPERIAVSMRFDLREPPPDAERG